MDCLEIQQREHLFLEVHQYDDSITCDFDMIPFQNRHLLDRTAVEIKIVYCSFEINEKLSIFTQ